mmetsp:Transcript_106240/g.310587  ORF Transcript_106240/g.310587 Transcript_106240/m.310587 type:complete len:303 (+) Transcript_106240:1258-2166(+)
MPQRRVQLVNVLAGKGLAAEAPAQGLGLVHAHRRELPAPLERHRHRGPVRADLRVTGHAVPGDAAQRVDQRPDVVALLLQLLERGHEAAELLGLPELERRGRRGQGRPRGRVGQPATEPTSCELAGQLDLDFDLLLRRAVPVPRHQQHAEQVRVQLVAIQVQRRHAVPQEARDRLGRSAAGQSSGSKPWRRSRWPNLWGIPRKGAGAPHGHTSLHRRELREQGPRRVPAVRAQAGAGQAWPYVHDEGGRRPVGRLRASEGDAEERLVEDFLELRRYQLLLLPQPHGAGPAPRAHVCRRRLRL